ncbi:MAG TPA: bifunctional UDP-N-acetylglucosamine diphosphorylase/glucosamine-1-phosphate N-acetyltransferase GlmU [Nitrospiraceae bacterium]|nr:bifunctional UDP-N-acetylglucosamine diphosphorylase/glucosamine-1-phosphate N-acetyltransferase GlmU [Nitrospiraceae bacterium]
MVCVILAAGIGKRMNSSIPKVLHTLCGKPMLQHVLNAVEKLKPEKKIIVVGKRYDEITRAVSGSLISYVLQKIPKGTGDALLKAVGALDNFKGTILVLNGDAPLVTADTVKSFLSLSEKNGDAVSVLSFTAENPGAYGRIIRDTSGYALQIIEEKDATREQKKVKEVNSGIYAIRSEALNLLSRIKLNRAKGEYYLTDLFEIAVKRNAKTGVYCLGSEEEMMGINTRRELLTAEKVMQQKIIDALIEGGVKCIDPASTYVHSGVKIGADTLLYPNVYLEGDTGIGRGCTIYPNVRITEGTIGNNVTIKDSSVIENSIVKQNAQIGPFAHLRPGSFIGSNAKIGNFVEVKKSSIGNGTKASHLSYIGDAVVGKDVNIGAGTITCNYDGKQKNKTEIHDGVFIGSDTQLIAPVKVGKGAYVGAGSTITEDVPPGALAIGRGKQRNIRNWARKRRANISSLVAEVSSRRRD